MDRIVESDTLKYRDECKALCEWMGVALVECGQINFAPNAIGKGFVFRWNGKTDRFDDDQKAFLEGLRQRVSSVPQTFHPPMIRNGDVLCKAV